MPDAELATDERSSAFDASAGHEFDTGVLMLPRKSFWNDWRVPEVATREKHLIAPPAAQPTSFQLVTWPEKMALTCAAVSPLTGLDLLTMIAKGSFVIGVNVVPAGVEDDLSDDELPIWNVPFAAPVWPAPEPPPETVTRNLPPESLPY